MTPKKRTRRSPEQMIQDLEAEIQRLKEKQTARELKQSEAHKQALAIVKAIDKGIQVAKDEGESALQHALVDARGPVAEYLEAKGLELPKVRRPRGRRPKNA